MPQQTGVVISVPVRAATFATVNVAIIGHSDGQQFMECIAWRQGVTANTGVAVRATSNPATNLANRLIPVPPWLRPVSPTVCDPDHLALRGCWPAAAGACIRGFHASRPAFGVRIVWSLGSCVILISISLAIPSNRINDSRNEPCAKLVLLLVRGVIAALADLRQVLAHSRQLPRLLAPAAERPISAAIREDRS